MVDQVALVLIAAAGLGLVFRRSSGWLARGLAFVAVLGIGFAALDREEQRIRTIPTELILVGTAPGSQDVEEAFAAAGVVRNPATPADPALAVAAERLARPREPDLAVVHNGSFPVSRRRGRGTGKPAREPIEGLQLLSWRSPAPIDPDRVQVRLVGVAEAGRPSVFEVLLADPEAKVELRGSLRVTGPEGRILVEAPLTGDSTERVDWQPTRGGSHEVALELWVGSDDERIEMRGAGKFGVGAAPLVTIVGAKAAALRTALTVQRIRIETVKELPANLQERGTLVLLDPLTGAQQERIRAFVEDGGGVFLVGAERGGAVPPPEEPLGAVLPVVRLPLPPIDEKHKNGGEAPGPGVPEPKTGGDSEKPKTAPPRSQPPDAATGDTKGAKLRITEMDVERRAIAMVLLVDRSGSMSEEVKETGTILERLTKMDIAKASALATAEALDAGDRLGIVSFGASAKIVLPLSPVENRKQLKAYLERLRSLQETTHVASALDAARKMLAKSKAAVKHVVIITDGEIHDVGPHYFGALSAARRLQTEKTGITLSLMQAAPLGDLAVGTSSRAKRLVAIGNGLELAAADPYYYQQNSFESVPRLLTAEVRNLRTKAGRPADKNAKDPGSSKAEDDLPAAKPPENKPPRKAPENRVPPKKPAVKVSLEVMAIEDSPLLEPRPATEYPRLAGILPVEAREEAVTLLVAGEEGTPLLAFANRGLGKIGVWTSDLVGAWGGNFAADRAFPGWLGQWVQHLAPARTVLHGVNVAGVQELSDGVPRPREVERLESLTGAKLQPWKNLVPPQPKSETTSHQLAERDALHGLWLLVLLAVVEFWWWRRGRA